ncbi:HXXEE domain-containing protein [Paenibacillus sp. KQZ6P-2]|uniref:HXXEE domain-containing protein n=1 Tax=Paenibacillus mangrovi TaxID=2931978 RepID=A0A9X1WPR5_9BACL|nr:HXXEE domain-containing protein [Paenibacillus mangrovi]MCJ8012818.1 HXXEE domain-containing protein [Paenibacillus mangrovi]
MSSSIIILFLFAFTIHNLEEAVWLTRQSSAAGKVKMHKPVSQDQFLFGLFWVTGLAYLITALYLFFPDIHFFKYAYFGYVGCMIINVIFPHLISTIIERCYSPGLFTGVLVIIPVHSLIIKTGLDTNTITATQLIASIIVAAAVIMASIPLSFKVGKKLITY